MKAKTLTILSLFALLLPTSCHKHKDNPVIVTEITLNKSEIELIVGDTLRILATITSANANVKAVIWASNNPDIATVDAGGLVTAISAGETFISATADEEVSACAVFVKEVEPEVSGNINMTKMTAEEVKVAIEAALKAGITEFKLSGPITYSGIGNVTIANPFSNNTQITKINLAETTNWPVTDFGDKAMPNNIIGIPAESFSNCTALTQVILPEEVNGIGYSAFQGCTSLKALDLNNITHIGNQAFKGAGLSGELELPQTQYIASNAFSNCSALTRLILKQQNVIGERAFANCTALQSITAPTTTTLDKQAFANCTALTTVDIPSLQKIGNSAFQDCRMLFDIDFPLVTYIGNYAFSGCSSLKSIFLPKAVEINEFAFGECTNLETLKLPQAIRFGYYLVSGCSNLSRIEISAAGNLLYTEEDAGREQIIDASIFNNTPFQNPPRFTTENCVLILNPDKQATATEASEPKASANNRWTDRTWKEIIFE